MKKIISGKMYNTGTATFFGRCLSNDGDWMHRCRKWLHRPSERGYPRLLPPICQGLNIIFEEAEKKFVYEWMNKDSMRRIVGKRKIRGVHPIN